MKIARGLSPFQPEKVAFAAGRLMLARIRELILAKFGNKSQSMSSDISNKEEKKITDKMFAGFQLAIKRLIEQTKKENGYLVISRNGKIEKVSAKDL